VVAANLGSNDWSFRAGPDAELLAASDHRIGRKDESLILPPDTVAILTTKGLSSL
jgi:hypothetical protein